MVEYNYLAREGEGERGEGWLQESAGHSFSNPKPHPYLYSRNNARSSSSHHSSLIRGRNFPWTYHAVPCKS